MKQVMGIFYSKLLSASQIIICHKLHTDKQTLTTQQIINRRKATINLILMKYVLHILTFVLLENQLHLLIITFKYMITGVMINCLYNNQTNIYLLLCISPLGVKQCLDMNICILVAVTSCFESAATSSPVNKDTSVSTRKSIVRRCGWRDATQSSYCADKTFIAYGS